MDAVAPAAQPEERRVAADHWASRLGRSADLLLACILALAAVLALALMPAGSLTRVVLVAPVVLVVPGYLLIQALVVREPQRRSRLVHVLLAVGVSPPVIGLLALSTALVPGGFKPGWIVAAVTLGCLLLAVVADYRRERKAAATILARDARGANQARTSGVDALPGSYQEAQ